MGRSPSIVAIAGAAGRRRTEVAWGQGKGRKEGARETDALLRLQQRRDRTRIGLWHHRAVRFKGGDKAAKEASSSACVF